MADKQISELPEVLGVADDTLIPVYVPGSATPAQRMTGAQFRMFAVDAAQGQAEKAETAAAEAEAAKEAAVLAREGIEQYVPDAQTAASLAEEAQVAAETAKAGAEAALTDVQAAKDAVDITKADIDSTALQVAADKEAAEAAKTAAETAQKASEYAQTAAEGASTSATEKAVEASENANAAALDAQAAEEARSSIENMLVEAVSLASGQTATVSKELVDGVVKLVFGLPAGGKGDPGSSIQSIDRTAGTGAPGTTDTYTVTMTEGSTTEFYVYNGKDGTGTGDMTAQVYDPHGKALDIYEYADNVATAAKEAANSYTDQQIASIPEHEEIDPTVPNWAKQPTKPAYTATEVGALPDTTPIPAALSDLSDDEYHRVVTDEEKTAWSAKADKSVSFTVSLSAAGWAGNAQTVSDARFLAAGYVYIVSPVSGNFAEYGEAGIYAEDVNTDGQMVFHCGSVPDTDLTVNIVRVVSA